MIDWKALVDYLKENQGYTIFSEIMQNRDKFILELRKAASAISAKLN